MRFLIVGFGKSGQAVAQYLASQGVECDVFDDRGASVWANAELPSDACRRWIDRPEDVLRDTYDEAVVSPGVPVEHELLKRLQDAGVPRVSELEFAARRVRGPIIGVTGSNGKSTTVSLIHHILSSAGRKATLCGNIGVPFTACIDEDPDRIFVVEISSFQLELIDTFCPQIGILLNVTSDHLDRHHDMNGYLMAKLRLFENQRPEHWAVFPQTLAPRIPGRAQRVPLPDPRARIEDGILWADHDYPVPLNTFGLLGQHNLSNLLFSCVAAKAVGIDAERVREALGSFRGLEHRLEIVGQHDGRTWINDSKATNIASTQVAVAAMAESYVLILGGSDKGADFSELDLSQNPPTHIVAYGQTAPKIARDLAPYAPRIVADFGEACRTAHALGQAGSTILLSPACASFDQFANFMERGRTFKSIFRDMTRDRHP